MATLEILEKNVDGLVYAYQVRVPLEEVQVCYQQHITDAAKQVRMPGYRPGHVPVKLIERRFAQELTQETHRQLIENSAKQLIEQEKLIPIVNPEVQEGTFDATQPLTYRIRIETTPNIPVPAFEDFVLQTYTVQPTEKEVTELLERVRAKNLDYTERAAGAISESGDRITADLQLTVLSPETQARLWEAPELTDHLFVAGEKSLLPDIAQAFVGVKQEQELSYSFTLPEQYNKPEYAGYPCHVHSTVKKIEASSLPDLDEAFAQRLGADNLEALRAKLRAELASEMADIIKERLRKDLLDTLEPECTFEAPPTLLKRHTEEIWEAFLQEKGYKDDEAAKAGLSDYDEIKQKYERVARRQVLLGLLFLKVADLQKITVSDEALREGVRQHILGYPEGYMRKLAIEVFTRNKEYLQEIRRRLLETQVIDYVLSRVTLETKELSVKEFERIFEEETAMDEVL